MMPQTAQATGLILASQSLSRCAMLDAAGVTYEAIPAHVDEAALTAALLVKGQGSREIARALATAKALHVSAANPGRVVLGSDSIVSLDGALFEKPRSRDDAAAHLRAFSGRLMLLDSAAVLARDGVVIDWTSDDARLEVRALSEDFITTYLDAEWPAIAACVGCFRIEARGVQLFERITGSHFTVLGMPLLPVLGFLRRHGVIGV
jgi:septum formation protein